VSTFSLSIPGWEQSQLTQLASENALSGVNPVILGAIDQAESSGDPGAPNPEGYGGFFGLSPTTTYPGGNIVGSGEGQDTVQEFDKEAIIAAAEFNSLLAGAGGDPIQAEYHYQQGGGAQPESDQALESGNFGDGPPLVDEALGGVTLQSDIAGPTGTGTSAGVSTGNPIQLVGIGAVLQSLDDIMNPSGGSTLTQILTLGGTDVLASVEGLVVRGLFSAAFIGVLYFGVKALSSSGGGTSTSIVNQIQGQQRIGQENQRLDIARTRTSQSQQRINQSAAREKRIASGTKASTVNKSKKTAKATSPGIEAATADALETVGEAAVL
jgi:hypothetical protein